MTLPGKASERFHLLFAVLTWLVPRNGGRIADIGRQFGLDDREVVELVELAACCGVPPYSPDALLDVYVDGDRVEANLGSLMGRPRRLSAREGFALAASARAIANVPGADPDGVLQGALAKLEAALGDRAALKVEIDTPEFLEGVRSAVGRRHQIEIEYYSASRDALAVRRIEPFFLFSVEGHWYVDAYCHIAEDVRHFRVDRIRSLVHTDRGFSALPPDDEHRVTGTGGSEFFQESPDVEIDVPASSRWVVDTLACRSVEQRGEGTIRVVLPMAGLPWLERMLMVLGSGASVVSPPELRGVGRTAAERVLALYR